MLLSLYHCRFEDFKGSRRFSTSCLENDKLSPSTRLTGSYPPQLAARAHITPCSLPCYPCYVYKRSESAARALQLRLQFPLPPLRVKQAFGKDLPCFLPSYRCLFVRLYLNALKLEAVSNVNGLKVTGFNQLQICLCHLGPCIFAY